MKQPIQKIRIAIVDDHKGVREGIKNLLKSADDLIVVGEAEDGVAALMLVKNKQPDVLLLDVELPVMRGDEVAQRVHEQHKTTKVLAISSYNDRLYIQNMLKNGAAGYITKDEAPAMLKEAIRSIARGDQRWISPQAELQTARPIPNERILTRRELQILGFIGRGASLSEISEHTGIEEEILERYISLLMRKFNIENQATLIEVAGQFLNDEIRPS